MLLLFTFSITPRQLLHDALANHTDLAATAPKGKQLQVFQAGFMCKVDNLVAESPFTPSGEVQFFIPPPVVVLQGATVLVSFPVQSLRLWSLRGPPASNA